VPVGRVKRSEHNRRIAVGRSRVSHASAPTAASLRLGLSITFDHYHKIHIQCDREHSTSKSIAKIPLEVDRARTITKLSATQFTAELDVARAIYS